MSHLYHVMPEIGDLRKKENKELKKLEEEKAEGKILLNHQDYDKIKGILKNYKKSFRSIFPRMLMFPKLK